MPPLFPLTLAVYAVACTLYFVAVAQPQLGRVLKAAQLALALAYVGQAIDIAWLCLHGQHPGSSAREALFFAAWLMVGAFPILTFRQPIPLLGALLLPVAMVMDVVARVTPSQATPGPLLAAAGHRTLGLVHIFSATLGIALFGVAAAASIVYVRSEQRLKRHRPAAGFAAQRPALETLDNWNRQSIAFGFLAFTIAMVTGTVWLILTPLPAAAPPVGGVGDTARLLLSRPQYTLSVLTWLLYAGLLGWRVAYGLRGRRAAAVTLYGFLAALSVLLLYLLRDVRVLHP
jgi:ABC-type uncharacterized transport system permease subunit